MLFPSLAVTEPCACATLHPPSQSWDVVGEVVGGPGGGEDTLAPAGSRVVGGRTWDYVFDVDVEDGSPPRRLPVDAGENPYVAADRFLAAEDLPTSYRWVDCVVMCLHVVGITPKWPLRILLLPIFLLPVVSRC